MRKNVNLETNMFKKYFFKSLKALVICIIISLIFVGFLLNFEIQNLNNRYKSYKRNAIEFNTELINNSSNEIIELTDSHHNLSSYEKEISNEGYDAYSNSGVLKINIFKYDENVILIQERHINGVKYKKKTNFKDFDYESLNEYDTVPAITYEQYLAESFQKRHRLLPSLCLEECEEFYRKKELSEYNEIKIDNHFHFSILPLINEKNIYYYFELMQLRPKTNFEKFKTDDFDIGIEISTRLYEIKFDYKKIAIDISFYTLLFFLIPIIYYIYKTLISSEKILTKKKILVIWIFLNYLILTLSYSCLRFFNAFGNFKINQLWPFVNYIEYTEKLIPIKIIGHGVTEVYENGEKEILNFYGIFTNYDFSEFMIYTILAILIYRIFSKPKL